MTIRLATEQDLPAICRLGNEINQQHHQAIPEVFAPNGEPERDRAFWAAQLTAADGAMLVVEADGEVAGFASLKLLTAPSLPFLQPHRACKINTIVVGERWRGQGLGSALVAAAENWGRQHQADEMRLEVMAFNQNALAFYQRLGMDTMSQILRKPL